MNRNQQAELDRRGIAPVTFPDEIGAPFMHNGLTVWLDCDTQTNAFLRSLGFKVAQPTQAPAPTR